MGVQLLFLKNVLDAGAGIKENKDEFYLGKNLVTRSLTSVNPFL